MVGLQFRSFDDEGAISLRNIRLKIDNLAADQSLFESLSVAMPTEGPTKTRSGFIRVYVGWRLKVDTQFLNSDVACVLAPTRPIQTEPSESIIQTIHVCESLMTHIADLY